MCVGCMQDFNKLDKDVALKLQSLDTGVQSLNTKMNTMQDQLTSISRALIKPPQQI